MRWLAQLHPDPASCLDQWICGRLARVPLGTFAVLGVSAGPGLEAVERLTPARPAGPVLHDRRRAQVAFLVHPSHLYVPPAVGVLRSTGTLGCPPPGRLAEGPGPWLATGARRRRAHGARWVIEPDGSGRLWRADAVLRAVTGALTAACEAHGLPATGTRHDLHPRSMAPFFTGARAAKTS